MEDILELFLTMILEGIAGGKYRRSKTRTWAMTVFFSVVAVILNGGIILGVVLLHEKRGIAENVVVGCFALAVMIASLVVIIRGHKKNWENY